MKYITIAAILAINTVAVHAADEASRIIGTWQSDRELTTLTLTIDGAKEPERVQKFSAAFGKMVLTITPKTIESYFPEKPDSRLSSLYEVVSIQEDRITIEYKDEDVSREITFSFKGDDVICTQTRTASVSFDEHFRKKK
jgi:hypothetical protein